MAIEYYILGPDGEPTTCDDAIEWGRWFETSDRSVARFTFGSIDVSTVFLGLDHSFGVGPPLLFETLIFGGEHEGEMRRYATREAALAGHRQMCLLALGLEEGGEFSAGITAADENK